MAAEILFVGYQGDFVTLWGDSFALFWWNKKLTCGAKWSWWSGSHAWFRWGCRCRPWQGIVATNFQKAVGRWWRKPCCVHYWSASWWGTMLLFFFMSICFLMEGSEVLPLNFIVTTMQEGQEEWAGIAVLIETHGFWGAPLATWKSEVMPVIAK